MKTNWVFDYYFAKVAAGNLILFDEIIEQIAKSKISFDFELNEDNSTSKVPVAPAVEH